MARNILNKSRKQRLEEAAAVGEQQTSKETLAVNTTGDGAVVIAEEGESIVISTGEGAPLSVAGEEVGVLVSDKMLTTQNVVGFIQKNDQDTTLEKSETRTICGFSISDVGILKISLIDLLGDDERLVTLLESMNMKTVGHLPPEVTQIKTSKARREFILSKLEALVDQT